MNLKRQGFILSLLLLSTLARGQSFDAPGEDPTWHQSQPNDYARLIQNNGIYPASTPNRTEYYLPLSGGSSYTVTATWNLVNDGLTISDRFYTPNQWLVGIPRLHAKGLIGTGVKIVLIGDGYSNSSTHEAIGTIAGSASSTYLHDAQVLGIMACKPTGNSKLIGGCYGAAFYSFRTTDLALNIDSARKLGARIIVISHDYGETTPAQIAAVRAFTNNGRNIILVAAGNGGSLGYIQPDSPPNAALAGLPGVYAIGVYRGGTVLSFVDSFYSRKILPVGGRSLAFVAPAYTISVFHGLNDSQVPEVGSGTDKYKNTSNTSYANPQIADLFALCMQRFPTLSAKMIFYMLRRNSRSFTQDGVIAFIPNLNFIR